MIDDLIIKHLEKYDLDVRKSKDARFTDQKCTPDVICAVCECIIDFVKDDTNKQFTINAIRYSEYSNHLVTDVFNKPEIKKTENEYDKFFSQPIKLLAYSKILTETKGKGNAYIYVVNNFELLNYISLRERNSLNFLTLYLTKVLKDSNIYQHFEQFFKNQDNTSLNTLREKLMEFYHTNTPINNDLEPPRIFNKIINILAYKNRVKGSVKGFLSSTILDLNEIRYNRPNWRDIQKEKNIPRTEFLQLFQSNISNVNHYNYSIDKAKKFVKEIHQFSEIHRFENYPATQAHHIFSQSEFPEIADYPENIIAITPNQHFYRAHPNNKTSVIDTNYQLICLLSKLDTIEMNYRSRRDDYNLEDFTTVLNAGYNCDFFNNRMDYEEIKHQIVNKFYDR